MEINDDETQIFGEIIYYYRLFECLEYSEQSFLILDNGWYKKIYEEKNLKFILIKAKRND